MRVLVIEDEASLREPLVARLKTEGYAVDASGDGEEGLYLGTEYPVDVEIVDLGLPGIGHLGRGYKVLPIAEWAHVGPDPARVYSPPAAATTTRSGSRCGTPRRTSSRGW